MDSMAIRRSPKAPGRAATRRGLGVAVSSAAAGASWIALVAATTVGLAELQRVRAEISVARHTLPTTHVGAEYRLVVQSYSAENMVGGVPASHARPLASAQRSVTAEELSRGVAVDVVGVGSLGVSDSEAPVVVAWVERGAPNLEFDGRRARPGRDAFIGTAPTSRSEGAAQARIVLGPRLA